MTDSVCRKCNKPINDKFISWIHDNSWHDQCLRCDKCGCQLTSKCFELDNELLCPEDYARKKFKKCSRCKGPIFPSDKVYYTNSSSIFHQNCFRCDYCDQTLISGDRYYTYSPGSIIICQYDYNSLKHELVSSIDSSNQKLNKTEVLHTDNDSKENRKGNIFQKFTTMLTNFRSSSSSGNLDDDFNSEVDPSIDENYSSDNDKSCEIRRRTPRTTIKASQLDSLKATFSITPKPSRQMREKLAECTGLSMRVIQVWFQNRRSKERRSKLSSQRKLEKYRFSIQNDLNREENLSNSSTNSRLIQRNLELQDMHIHLNSVPRNFETIQNVQTEQMNDNRYVSNWFINRSVDV